ncbi:MAG TPA: hypothetical protein VF556_08100 [Pyrinomonadaceae bacterium]|jgi:hypothetical protein
MREKSVAEHRFKTALQLFLFLIFCAVSIQAQTCRDPYVYLVLPDKKGNIIDPTTLEEPKYDAKNIKTFSHYGGENVAKQIKVVDVEGSGSCSLKLDTLTLKHQGKTMRLSFNLIVYTYNPPRDKGDFRLVYDTFEAIKLPPMQNGTFEYVLPDYEKTILPDWKKLSDKVLSDEEIKAARPTKKQN